MARALAATLVALAAACGNAAHDAIDASASNSPDAGASAEAGEAGGTVDASGVNAADSGLPAYNCSAQGLPDCAIYPNVDCQTLDHRFGCTAGAAYSSFEEGTGSSGGGPALGDGSAVTDAATD